MSCIVGIMQPYFFPYLGYWQLMHAVDRFVIYDDVQFIKGGWVNRNRLLIAGQPTFVTVPLYHSSPNKRICDLLIQDSPDWRDRFLRTIEVVYRRAPHFAEVFPVIAEIIAARVDSLADLLVHQLKTLSALLRFHAELIVASASFDNQAMVGQERVIDICRHEGATTYVNLMGGISLYRADQFAEAGIDLRFISMKPVSYRQRSPGFSPGLSIIDLLMEVGVQEVQQHLASYELLSPAMLLAE